MTTIREDSMPVVLNCAIDPTTTTSAVRRRLTAALDLGDDHRYDVSLVVTELVSNILDHASGVGRLRVRWRAVPCTVVVEVDDTSPLQPVHGRSRLEGARGRGIMMVDALSGRWGTRALADGGKTVFAVVGCRPPQ